MVTLNKKHIVVQGQSAKDMIQEINQPPSFSKEHIEMFRNALEVKKKLEQKAIAKLN
ncbi:hypothetical protein ABE504_29575 [Paenibacillus oryzisoli]|uniref:hypothetical protein n=1 Tax=Paenibacillus oryzisoli TaxID=1850517 RepID=UPI003D2D5A3C